VIEAAADLLGRQERVSRQLFVITDRQASAWRTAGEEFVDRWRTHAPLGRFIVIPVGGAETDNLIVESVSVINPPAVARCAGEVQVRVRNYGVEARSGVPMTVRIGARELATTTLNIPAGETVTTTAAVTFGAAGPQRLSAEIRGGTGGPSLDDRREIVIDVSPPLRTLVLRSQSGRVAVGTDFIRAALAPADEATAVGAVAAVDTIAADELNAAGLSGYRCVILDDVAALDRGQVTALEQFVYGGGGLIVAPGSAARTGEYNRLMYREEGGLLPALLQPPVAPPEPLSIERASIEPSHPMLHFLAGQGGGGGGGGALTPAISRYVAITARTAEARVVANYSNGDAFLIEQPFGRGRVVLVTCSLRGDFSTLPLTPVYLPVLQSMVRFAAGATVRERNVPAGQELVARFEPAVDAPGATVTRPDGSRDTCEIVPGDGRSEARYGPTLLAGAYTIRAGDAPPVWFAVAPPPTESDLTPLDEAGWDRLREQLGFVRMETSAGGRTLAARLVGGRDHTGVAPADRYWLAALAGVLMLFVIELALARAWAATPTTAKRRWP
jgi:hypothetical protein